MRLPALAALGLAAGLATACVALPADPIREESEVIYGLARKGLAEALEAARIRAPLAF